MPRINKEYREDAKRKIITAALDVAASEGWECVTLEAIARKVGVTKGAFYSYFPNSNLLMQDVIIEMVRTTRDQMLTGLSGESDIHAALDRISDFIFMDLKSFIPVFIQAVASGMIKDLAFREKLLGLIDENSILIITALTRYQEDGQIPKEVDVTSEVRAIYGMTIGLAMMTHILGKDARETKQVWMNASERILQLKPSKCRK